jgi:hypothetical protein
MAKFDWLSFVEKNRISYETRKNVARNHIAIHCPFCGGADPSAHMGLSLDVRNPVWGCLRDNRHRGRNPVWLVQRILNCGMARASEIVTGNQSTYGDTMAEEVKRATIIPNSNVRKANFLTPKMTVTECWQVTRQIDDEPGELTMPREIKPISGNGYSGIFLDYLKGRGFNDPWPAVDYGDLHYAVTGKFGYRLVIPVKLGGRIVSYTGRDITGRSDLRYKTLSNDESAMDVKSCLGFEDRVAAGGEVLFLTEGPIDALKMNVYLQPDCGATCFFGMPERSQVSKVLMYAQRWRLIVVLLDPEAAMQRLALWYALQLGSIQARQVRLPRGVADPGALTAWQVRELGKSLLPA